MKIKRTLIVPLAFVALLLSNCHCSKQQGDKDDDSQKNDTLPLLQTKDSTLWGRMGEGSSMNVYEFISDNGDTLYLSKSSEDSDEEAMIMGALRNFTDRFAVTTRGTASDETSLLTCVNVSQLMGAWTGQDNSKLSLFIDGTADNGAANYTSWKMVNGRLILSGKVTTEYGETDRIDTMRIEWLDDDSLKLVTPQHETISFGR